MPLANSSCLLVQSNNLTLLLALHVELSLLLVPLGTGQPDHLVNDTVVSLLVVSLIVMGISRFASMPHLWICTVHEEKFQFHHEQPVLVLLHLLL